MTNLRLEKALRLCLLGAAALSLGACSFHARSAEDYKNATRALLETQQSSFKQCYEGVIASDPAAAGNVAISFELEEKTGKIVSAKSLPESTAPEPLQQCVVNGLNGLALDPPDQRRGIATMTFEFARG